MEALEKNCKEFGVEYFNELDIRQGIVHVVGPEQGFTLPNKIMCGDSHTSTHALEHLRWLWAHLKLNNSCYPNPNSKKGKNFRVNVGGTAPDGVTAKDIILPLGRSELAVEQDLGIEYTGKRFLTFLWKEE
ncbi:MAG: hypothetical protein CM15mP73_1400 [Hyphomicrobiales bacterium]|nr:MAG: hypothetical protein CM15mP73_1400 [Hyphomicrobiales bacterium]